MGVMPTCNWTCDICGNSYEDKDDAYSCEEKGRGEPRFKPGDTVYVYDCAREVRGYAARTVEDVVSEAHGWRYGLNKVFEGKSGHLFGAAGPKSGQYFGRAHERQLLLIGDPLDEDGDGTLTEEMVKWQS